MLTLEGEDEARRVGRSRSCASCADLIAQGHEIAPGTIDAVQGALDQHESPGRILEDVVWRHRSTKVAPKTVNQKRYVDSIRRNTITFGVGPAGTGKTFLAVAMAAAALARREVNRIILTRPAVEAGERLGFLPGDLMAKVDPYLRPLFDALHDMIDPERVSTVPRARRDRGRAARVHARPHAQRQLHHPRRGAEHEPRADEDVPHAARLQLEDGRHRRRHADRPADRPAVRPRRRRRGARARSRGSSSSASAARTSCATSSCSGSSPPTPTTSSASRPSCAAADRRRA